MIRLLNIFFLVLALVHTTSSKKMGRVPASTSDEDSCHIAMRELYVRSSHFSSTQVFTDKVIDLNRLMESGKLSHDDFFEIYNSPEWRNFFVLKDFDASEEEKVLIASLLKKTDPDAPIDSLQRKYSLLIEFCGL